MKLVSANLLFLVSFLISSSCIASEFENTEDKPLENPEKTIEQTFEIRNGKIEVILDDLKSFDAYSFTINLVE